MKVILVTGVSGVGKTTIGAALAQAIGARFEDADAYHPPQNVEKMKRGQPLDDADRAPWLAALEAQVRAWLAAPDTVVLACSALKERYRAQLTVDPEQVRVVYLTASRALLEQRLLARRGHFFDPALLPSQLAAVEEPSGALVVDASQPVAAVVQLLCAALA
ncbi:MAG: gluconokinase [Archangiaceae bacterium]|nr:gluconokinase [Archangiaceae bacterium]